MIHGYHGYYLRIDLSAQSVERIAISADVLKQFIGGVGLGTYLLMHETDAGYDPLGENAPIFFVTSPLVGTPLTTSAKFAICAKSPLTGRICDAMCSSQFAIMAKKLGCDAICIRGRAIENSILFLENKNDARIEMQLIDAGAFLGLSAIETEKRIRIEFGQKWSVSSIGPAGEKQIPFATISHDGRHAGRGGLGAVFGSKNLKAIAIHGKKTFSVAHPDQTIQIAKDLSARSFGPETAKYRELGTISNLLVFNRFSSLPVRNFQDSSHTSADQLIPESIGPARRVARNSCTSCTIGCEHLFELKSSDGDSKSSTRLEYESLFALGPNCGIHDPDIVLAAAKLCDEIGIDTISTGVTIAFLMQCIDHQLINPTLNDGFTELRFGHSDSLTGIIKEFVSDHPGHLAKLLRLGSRRAAQEIGQNSIAFACQVKGLEMPGYHPARLHAMALGMAVGTRGADHNRSGAYEIDFSKHSDEPIAIASSVAAREDYSAVMDSLILCKFLRGIFSDFYQEAASMINSITGFQLSTDDLKRSGEEIVMLRRAFNQREGWEPSEDNLPENIYQADVGNHQILTKERFHSLLQSYYQYRKLTPNGFIREMEYNRLTQAIDQPFLNSSSD